MTQQSIISQDMTLGALFQSFYRVPDYQREYVWGEANAKGEGGEEVDQFLRDIYAEYENASPEYAPEYFIGTIVVCPSADGVFDLIDGQQRTTTSYLTLCAIRDALEESGHRAVGVIKPQIATESADWQGHVTHRYRLDLQYEDARQILVQYAKGEAATAPRDGTRSIRNIGNAYDTVREFLQSELQGDSEQISRFYGYLTNKVKIIRIETPTVTKALKIFETINDRGVGLDAMDLLKNLLFMNAKADQFSSLKITWEALTKELYKVGEKPLRFLRYYVLASFHADSHLREDALYDWFQKNEKVTKHASEPLAFAKRLHEAAQAYANFASGKNKEGVVEHGIQNTRLLGGQSIKQHFMLLLAGRHLSPQSFKLLADEIEKTMFVWLITGTPGKEYERSIVEAAHKLRTVSDKGLADFVAKHLASERAAVATKFGQTLASLKGSDTRQFRVRYFLAKLTQHFDLLAYGPSEGRSNLATYTAGGNDIEHIHPAQPAPEAVEEFGDRALDSELTQRLGNLLLIEKSINRTIQNKRYSEKIAAYRNSNFLLTKCQADKEAQFVGVADKITSTAKLLEHYPAWSASEIEKRQRFLTRLAHQVWSVPEPAVALAAE